jgi:oligoribonuclease
MAAEQDERLIWIDLEMTGLDTRQDEIIEIATLITDAELEILAEGPVMAIHQPAAVLEGMDEWNTRQHHRSGLVDRVRDSAVTYTEAETRTLEFLRAWVAAGSSPMCGNSICQDRRFLARLMPELERFFHYRNLDVSSVKELIQRWSPALLKGVEKSSSHLALDDIRDSVSELRYYRKHAFAI